MIWKVIGLSICGERGYGRKLLLVPASSLSQNKWSWLRKRRAMGGGIYVTSFCGIYASLIFFFCGIYASCFVNMVCLWKKAEWEGQQSCGEVWGVNDEWVWGKVCKCKKSVYVWGNVKNQERVWDDLSKVCVMVRDRDFWSDKGFWHSKKKWKPTMKYMAGNTRR